MESYSGPYAPQVPYSAEAACRNPHNAALVWGRCLLGDAAPTFLAPQREARGAPGRTSKKGPAAADHPPAAWGESGELTDEEVMQSQIEVETIVDRLLGAGILPQSAMSEFQVIVYVYGIASATSWSSCACAAPN